MPAAFKECELSMSSVRSRDEDDQKCVLLIEDNEEAMFLVQFALQEYGDGAYRLEWADGLSAGLERLHKGGVDVILLDLGLPDSSGPASYSWLREAAPEVPVLVLTGDGREETEFTVAASGVADYLVKDQISGALLVQALRAALHTTNRGDGKKRLAASLDEEPSPRGIRSFISFPTGHN
jgi:phosphoserine phosphatase RsbU/P